MERNTTIALAACLKINHTAMGLTLEPHSNPNPSWQQRKSAFSACAEDPNSYLNAMAAINCSLSEMIEHRHKYIHNQYFGLINVRLSILIPQLYNRPKEEMVNYNMGQYYAWTNLTKLLKSFYRRHFFSPSYKFTYIPPKIHTNHTFVPF